ncbi:hypothetical protein GGI05_001868 [Coemansia sp. RSA 2603]|nr:hypothetical protein GGI05_001868 [Coemansia sp. RSA 2603]
MVGYCHPRNELMVFDSRLGSNMGAPVMTLKDAGNQITSRYNRPAWDAETGLICSPVRRYVDGRDTTMINVWDPRFIKCSDADNFMLYRNKHEVLSVDFTKSMVGKDRIMVTASEDNVGFTPFTLKRS